MKKQLLTTLLLSVAFVFSACSDGGNGGSGGGGTPPNYSPGQIPGLGEQGGALTGTSFELPQGIEVATAKLQGYDPSDLINPWPDYYSYSEPATASNSFSMAKFRANSLSGRSSVFANNSDIDIILGCGENVAVLIPLVNNTAQDRKVEFPAGLIVESESGDYQNGVLIKKEEVTVPANSSITVLLLMECGNANKSASSYSEDYDFAVITDADPIKELCALLANKKINFSQYPNYLSNKSVTEAFFSQYNTEIRSFVDEDNEYVDYIGMIDFFNSKSAPAEAHFYMNMGIIQDLLWKLTDDGLALTSEDRQIISKMKN